MNHFKSFGLFSLLLLIIGTGCSQEDSPVQLISYPVSLRVVNHTDYGFESLNVEFKTYTENFTLSLSDLKKGELSDFYDLPVYAPDIKETIVKSTIEGWEQSYFEFGKIELSPMGDTDQFIRGNYQFVLNISDGRLNDVKAQKNEEVEVPAGVKRIKIENIGDIDFRNVSVFFPKEECLQLYTPESCKSNIFQPAIEFGAIPFGESSLSIDVDFAVAYTFIQVETDLGVLEYYPIDHGPREILDEGAYTYKLEAVDYDHSQIVKELSLVE